EYLDDMLGDPRPESLPLGFGIRNDEEQVGVGANVEFTHAQAPERYNHHFALRLLKGLALGCVSVSMCDSAFETDPVCARDHEFSQRRCAIERLKDWLRQADTAGLDGEHLAAEETAQTVNIVQWRGKTFEGPA